MAQDLMLSKMVEYILFNDVRNTRETLLFFKENKMWGKQKGRIRSLCWCNAIRLVETFRLRYISYDDDYYIPDDDRRDFANKVREWKIKEIYVKKMLRMAQDLRYVQSGLELEI